MTHTDYTTPGWVRPVSEGEQFFYEHAGWGYMPGQETPEEGRWRRARALRAAEVHAEREGWTVEWERDYDGEWLDRDDPDYGDWPHYQATLHDANGEHLTSLAGVMFADRGDETTDSYARVVAAELALEAMDR